VKKNRDHHPWVRANVHPALEVNTRRSVPKDWFVLVVAFGLRHFQVVVVLLAGDSTVD
jgi:hypothetical protein